MDSKRKKVEDNRKLNSMGYVVNRLRIDGSLHEEEKEEENNSDATFGDDPAPSGENSDYRYIPMEDRIKRVGIGSIVIPDKRRHEELKNASQRPVYPEGISCEGGTSVLGGSTSLEESRYKLLQNVRERTKKTAKLMKEEERKTAKKAVENEEYLRVKQKARDKVERQKVFSEELRKVNPDVLRRQRDAFLTRFQNS